MEKVHGGDIYSYEKNIVDFSANINPLGIEGEVAEAISNSVSAASVYPDTEYRKLREAISEIENVPPEYIVCGNGAAELIFNLVMAIRPKRVLLTAPTFAEYEKAVDVSESGKVFFTLTEEQGFKVDESILSAIDSVDMMFLCQPNNPTGKLIEYELMERIIEKCSEKNVFLVIDECFLDFTGKKEDFSSVRFIENCKRLFILKAFTKMFAIPGIRMGYGICSDLNIIDKIYSVRQPWNVSCTAEATGIACCKIYDDTVTKTTKYITKEKDFLYSSFERMNIKYFRSAANYILFKSEEGLKKKMAEKGFLIRSCSNYRGLDGSFYRIAVKKHNDNTGFIKALEECLCQKQ